MIESDELTKMTLRRNSEKRFIHMPKETWKQTKKTTTKKTLDSEVSPRSRRNVIRNVSSRQ